MTNVGSITAFKTAVDKAASMVVVLFMEPYDKRCFVRTRGRRILRGCALYGESFEFSLFDVAADYEL